MHLVNSHFLGEDNVYVIRLHPFVQLTDISSIL